MKYSVTFTFKAAAALLAVGLMHGCALQAPAYSPAAFEKEISSRYCER